MSITYAQLYHLNLSKLDAAIETWRNTTTHLKGISNDYTTDVGPSYRTAGWASADGASAKADKQYGDIEKEIDDAHGIAKATHANLQEIRERLHSLRESLRHLADVEAAEQNLRVSATGAVSPAADGHGDQPDQSAVDAFAARISRTLSDATQADADAAATIAKNISGGGNGFQSSPNGDISKPDDAVADYTPPGMFGSKTIKPAVEFLSFRPWINSFDHLIHGEFPEAWDDFLGGVPSFAAGEASGALNDKYGGGSGKHRKLTPLNKLGIAGGKIFSAPVGVVATVVDFVYTPAREPEEKEQQTNTLAPKAPSGKVS
ncbi:hypothetical protein [Streptomyces sp. HNM0574]|uniref:hypothetical protein n=1 Tax=Streptomyces sp. HNM0574 TaxID=2714954 RepID=UPI00146CD3F2|nr:hypothetical protein [Streptomyces sp. HNM0574]NLU70849.1 hypothetical protein [Streptomyces sp. HNM0574]